MSTPGDMAEGAERRLCEEIPELASVGPVGRLRIAEILQDAIEDAGLDGDGNGYEWREEP